MEEADKPRRPCTKRFRLALWWLTYRLPVLDGINRETEELARKHCKYSEADWARDRADFQSQWERMLAKTFVICGYGMCGRGLANRSRGMGAHVVVTEVEPVSALQAVMDGFKVMSMDEAAVIGDIFCTVTGNTTVLTTQHFEKMKNGALVANSGHFNVEIDIEGLAELASKVNRNVRNYVDEYLFSDGRSIYLLGEGRLINLVAAEGHPADVMDMSFALQSLMAEYSVQNDLTPEVHSVPREIDKLVASLKLQTMGIEIDTLTDEQETYLNSWEGGT